MSKHVGLSVFPIGFVEEVKNGGGFNLIIFANYRVNR